VNGLFGRIARGGLALLLFAASALLAEPLAMVSAPAVPAPPAPEGIRWTLLLPPVSHSLSAAEEDLLTQTLTLRLSQGDSLALMPQDEAEHRMRQDGWRNLPRCLSARCAVDAGQQVGAARVLSLWAWDRGDDWLLRLDLWSVSDRRLLASGEWNAPVSSTSDLLNLATRASDSINTQLRRGGTTMQAQVEQWGDHQRTALAMVGSAALLGVAYWAMELGFSGGTDPAEGWDPDSYEATSGGLSGLRGLYASLPGGARYRALGAQGAALVDDALSPLWNPAGTAALQRPEWRYSHVRLPLGLSKHTLAFASPLTRHISHAQLLQTEGDDLLRESMWASTLAADLSPFTSWFRVLRVGTTLKAYGVQVGQECEGVDCSHGSSVGWGMDLGVQGAFQPEVLFGAMLRDPLSGLSHRNDLTGKSYREDLPPGLELALALRPSPITLLQVGSTKALYADQQDHLSLGAEHQFFGLLWLRGGIRQTLGQPDRLWTTGLGVDHRAEGHRLTLDYSFDASDENLLLDGRQCVDLGVGF
jgi:hypothetical protein